MAQKQRLSYISYTWVKDARVILVTHQEVGGGGEEKGWGEMGEIIWETGNKGNLGCFFLSSYYVGKA